MKLWFVTLRKKSPYSDSFNAVVTCLKYWSYNNLFIFGKHDYMQNTNESITESKFSEPQNVNVRKKPVKMKSHFDNFFRQKENICNVQWSKPLIRFTKNMFTSILFICKIKYNFD